MNKFFLSVLGITSGLVLSLSIIGAGAYWWLEVRAPSPPDITIELDGFPDTRKQKDGTKVALIRIVITNNEESKVSINDAYLYLTRASDGARVNFKFNVGDMVIYPKERYLEIVESIPVKKKWIDLKDSDEFKSKEKYFAHKELWIAQIKEVFNKFNFTFVSDKNNIHILLDTQKKIADIENNLQEEKKKQ